VSNLTLIGQACPAFMPFDVRSTKEGEKFTLTHRLGGEYPFEPRALVCTEASPGAGVYNVSVANKPQLLTGLSEILPIPAVFFDISTAPLGASLQTLQDFRIHDLEDQQEELPPEITRSQFTKVNIHEEVSITLEGRFGGLALWGYLLGQMP